MERTRGAANYRLATAALAAIALGFGLLATSPSASAQEALDCEDFASQAAAQAAYRADPSDPADNDADGDGIACELFDFADPATDYVPVVAAGADTTTTTTTMAATGTGSALAGQITDSSSAGLAVGLLGAAAVCGVMAVRGLRRARALA
jgi:hypothetical protein